MNIFVTGATGVLGKPVVRLLVEAGHKVYALSRSEENTAAVRQLGAEPITANLFDLESLIKALETTRADAIVHLATKIPPTSRILTAATDGLMRSQLLCNPMSSHSQPLTRKRKWHGSPKNSAMGSCSAWGLCMGQRFHLRWNNFTWRKRALRHCLAWEMRIYHTSGQKMPPAPLSSPWMRRQRVSMISLTMNRSHAMPLRPLWRTVWEDAACFVSPTVL